MSRITGLTGLTKQHIWCKRLLSSSNSQPYFITTPIFYVNAVPHIGHLYTALLADTLARWKKLKGDTVLFSTGTDEHGLKIQQSAKLQDRQPQEHCDLISNQFRKLFSETNIEYTQFVRTTEKRHVKTVQHFWKCLQERGHIYQGSYEGWYSVSDEAFLSDNQVIKVKDKNNKTIHVAEESGQPVEWIKEDNYMFPLTNFKSDLLHWIRQNKTETTRTIEPSKFEDQVCKWIDTSLQDLSISRTRDRLHWGIPVPDDPSQTIYVWLDALVNYLTVGGYPDLGYHWPADCQIVGKDILKFHAVYWPAFLMAAGLDPPRQILCHSHWLIDGFKMSKSRGNVVDPFAAVEQYTADGIRYFLMREAVTHSDGNFTHRRVVEILNSELANTFGNLLNRCCSKTLNPNQTFPTIDINEYQRRARSEDEDMLNKLNDLTDVVDHYFELCLINKAIEEILNQLRLTNSFMEYWRPWDLIKDQKNDVWLNCVLHLTMETLRITATLLQPVIPTLSHTVLDRLNIAPDWRSVSKSKEKLPGGHLLNSSTEPLFRRISDK